MVRISAVSVSKKEPPELATTLGEVLPELFAWLRCVNYSIWMTVLQTYLPIVSSRPNKMVVFGKKWVLPIGLGPARTSNAYI